MIIIHFIIICLIVLIKTEVTVSSPVSRNHIIIGLTFDVAILGYRFI